MCFCRAAVIGSTLIVSFAHRHVYCLRGVRTKMPEAVFLYRIGTANAFAYRQNGLHTNTTACRFCSILHLHLVLILAQILYNRTRKLYCWWIPFLSLHTKVHRNKQWLWYGLHRPQRHFLTSCHHHPAPSWAWLEIKRKSGGNVKEAVHFD